MNQPKIELTVPQLNLPPIAQISHVEELTGFHRSTLRRWWDEGKFPRPQKLNGSTLIWSTQIVLHWIEENIKGGANPKLIGKKVINTDSSVNQPLFR